MTSRGISGRRALAAAVCGRGSPLPSRYTYVNLLLILTIFVSYESSSYSSSTRNILYFILFYFNDSKSANRTLGKSDDTVERDDARVTRCRRDKVEKKKEWPKEETILNTEIFLFCYLLTFSLFLT